MAKLFSLSTDVKTIAQNAIDDLIDQLGKDCLLLFPPIPESCVNCIIDPIGNKSSNYWINGGPIPFPNASTCPMCDGRGYHFKQLNKPIKLLISNSPSQWFVKLPVNIQSPAGTIQTKGYVADLPDVLQCRKMIVQISLEPIIRYTYELDGEPIDQGNIVQNRYWVGIWNRIGA
jgi:hypothetical protein